MGKPGLGERLKKLFKASGGGKDFYDDFEDILIEGDIGVSAAMEISEKLKIKFGGKGPSDRDAVSNELKSILDEMILTADPGVNPDEMTIIMVLGVNGVGKTTTIAKMADYYRKKYGLEPILSAGDTFRAAAIDQLKLHGERLDLKVVHQQPGSDPGAVIFDSIESAKAHGSKMIIADTAGRMHNKANLVKELQKIDKIINSRAADAVYRKILVIDATTGQNGFRQAEMFNEAVGIDQIVLTKYDSSAKGGIAVSISSKLGLPFSFIGTGEKYSDFSEFSKDGFIENMLKG
ncbi:MAG: signal recognition particle-docking protein FtsY [Spirochaetales bacterium]|nr:signal recognition particle-docking protein FtsY [Spirochaetales bacterium]